MAASRMFALAAMAAALSACGAVDDDDDNLLAANQSVSAEGKAQEGKISVKAPGVDISFSVPKELTVDAKAGKDNKLLYPNATLSGIAFAAGEKDNHNGDTDVEVRFKAPDPLDKVAAWYRDPARAEGFRLTSETREGTQLVLAGVQRDRHAFKVTLGPGAGGGTEGRVRVHHD
jgi:hypothetical protein